MSKLRLREVKSLAQGHIAGKCQGRILPRKSTPSAAEWTLVAALEGREPSLSGSPCLGQPLFLHGQSAQGPGTAGQLQQESVLTFVNTSSVKGLINFLFQWGDNEF